MFSGTRRVDWLENGRMSMKCRCSASLGSISSICRLRPLQNTRKSSDALCQVKEEGRTALQWWLSLEAP